MVAHLNDRQFNVVALADTGGTVVQRMLTTPYGQARFCTASYNASTNTKDWRHLFQGLRQDYGTALYQNRNRDLHPLLGRFVQRDPLGYPDGLNAYAAYHVMWGGVDPSGEAGWGPAIWAVGRWVGSRVAAPVARYATNKYMQHQATRQLAQLKKQQEAAVRARQAEQARKAAQAANKKTKPKKKDSESCPVKKCKITKVARRGGNKVHDTYAATLGPGEWKVTTPEGVSTTYDARKGNMYYEAKTGHKGWINEEINPRMKASRAAQFTTQQAVAARCKLVYIIAVDNEVGADGLKKHLAAFPIQHIP